jgi:hypothetical protein
MDDEIADQVAIAPDWAVVLTCALVISSDPGRMVTGADDHK